jgi:hypothetical protein
MTRPLPYRGRTRPQLAVRGKKRDLDDRGRPVCSRGHVVLDNNVVKTGDKSDACKTCANMLGWARRHNLFVDDLRVLEHMRKTYERLMGTEVDTPPTGG